MTRLKRSFQFLAECLRFRWALSQPVCMQEATQDDGNDAQLLALLGCAVASHHVASHHVGSHHVTSMSEVIMDLVMDYTLSQAYGEAQWSIYYGGRHGCKQICPQDDGKSDQ